MKNNFKSIAWGVAAMASLTLIGFASEPKDLSPEPPRNYSVGMSTSKLFVAVDQGKTVEVTAMLQEGADANERGHHGSSPLADAAGNGHLEIVKLLLANGAQVNAHDMYGDTALRRAAGNGRYAIAKLLLDKGANVNAKIHGNNTPLMSASAYGHPEVIKLLLDKGADINVTTEPNGMTALMYAVNKDKLESARILIKRGANTYVRTQDGKTPLQLAQTHNNKAMIFLLKQMGAKE